MSEERERRRRKKWWEKRTEKREERYMCVECHRAHVVSVLCRFGLPSCARASVREDDCHDGEENSEEKNEEKSEE